VLGKDFDIEAALSKEAEVYSGPFNMDDLEAKYDWAKGWHLGKSGKKMMAHQLVGKCTCKPLGSGV